MSYTEESKKIYDQTIVQKEKVRVHCPGCGKEVQATSYDGKIQGYCSKSRQVVEALPIISNGKVK